MASKRPRSTWATLGMASALGVAVVLAACGSPDPGADVNSAGGIHDAGGAATCATPSQGCPCQTGQTVDCGQVVAVSGTSVSCSQGTRTCDASGTWGACVGAKIAQRKIHPLSHPDFEVPFVSPSAGFRPLNLQAEAGADAGPCVGNPCDPFCLGFKDTPQGLDASPPFTVNDAGLTLVPVLGEAGGCGGFTGLTITPNPGLITVTQIPSNAAPVTNPSPLQLQAQLQQACGNPLNTPAAWALSNTNTTVISTTGAVSVYYPVAETLTATAQVGSYTATDPVKVVVNANEVDPNVNAGIAALFPVGGGGGTATDPMVMLYPYNNTVYPRGITPPVIQWSTGGKAAQAVKVTLRYLNAGAGIDFTFSRILPETNPPRYQPPSYDWWPFDQTAAGATAQITVQRVLSGVLQLPVTTNIVFSQVPLRGTIYYWEARSQPNGSINSAGINKIDVQTGARTQDYIPTSGSNGNCIACHTVSADGSTIVAQLGPGVEYGPGGVWNANTKAQTFTRNAPVNWQALSPTGTYTIWGDAGNLSLTTSNAVMGTIQSAMDTALGLKAPQTTGDFISMPEFSPDGLHVSWISRSAGFGAWAGYFWGNWNSLAFGNFPACGGTACYGKGNNVANMWETFGSGWAWGGTPTFGDGYSQFPWSVGTWSSGAPNWSFGTGFAAGAGTCWGPASNGQCDGGYTVGTNSVWVSQNHYWYYYSGALWSADFQTTPPYFTNVHQTAQSNLQRPAIAYPTYTPDGNWIAYHMGQQANSRYPVRLPPASKMVGFNAELYMSSRNGATQIPMTNANGVLGPGQLTQAGDVSVNYEPTAKPDASPDYNWLVFTSHRSYGNTLQYPTGYCPNGYGPKDCGLKQLWVTALNPTPTAGVDPSAPAFWLPGQDTTFGNMRGYWTKPACIAAAASCQTDSDCCGYNPGNPPLSTALCRINTPVTFPLSRSCTAVVPGMCAPTGKSCNVSTDCCNYVSNPQDVCVAGTCATVVPPPAVQYSQATWTRDYSATCPVGSIPLWHLFQWETLIPTAPAGASISFSVQGAGSEPNLTGAPGPFALGTQTVSNPPTAPPPDTGWVGKDIGQVLQANGQSPNSTWVRISITFNPTTDKTAAPTLLDWQLGYDCVASE